MEKEKEVLAIDIDDVLADTLPTFLEYYNNKYGTNFKKEDFYTYEWSEILGITREEAIDNVYEFILNSDLKIPPMQGSQKAIDLLKTKYKIILSTNRPNDFQQITLEWQKIHFPDSIHSVHFGNHYAKNNEIEKKKSTILKQIDAKYLVEDQLKVAIECATKGIQVYLMTNPWNKNLTIPKDLKIYRVASWEEIIEKLKNNLS